MDTRPIVDKDNPRQSASPREVPDLPERMLLDLHGDCNLKCPMCFRHGEIDRESKKAVLGTMDEGNFRALLDEVMSAQPLIQAATWGEPFLAPKIKDRLRDMKERGITVAINTNGLLMKEDVARFLIDEKVDVVFVSLDATKPETLKITRGIDKLDKIRHNLETLIELRGKSTHPRIGATMTIQDANENEVEDFVDYWTKRVDVVRLGWMMSKHNRSMGIEVPKERTPCGSLYVTMPVHYNGDALLCCLDSDAEHVMGNVFEDGVHEVWHGEGYTRMRRLHEEGRWDELPFCKSCEIWAGYQYEEEVRDGLLIRRSPQFVYYNRIDRLESWRENLRGHTPPPEVVNK